MLTRRQQQVAHYLINGLQLEQIGDAMNITPSCVCYHFRLICKRLGVYKRFATCARLVLRGIMPPPEAYSASNIDDLLPRERAILHLLSEGNTIKETAAALGLSVSCVMTLHIDAARDHLGVKTTVEAVCIYAEMRRVGIANNECE